MKENYEAPLVQVIEMEVQGVIALSGNGMDNPDVPNHNV